MINAKIPTLLIGTLMLLPTACMSAEEAAAKARARCRPLLHRPESIDDLVVQMYRTALEDDCLYSMETEELERIWEIPVIYSLNWSIDLESPAVQKKVQHSRLDVYIHKRNFLPTEDMFRKPHSSYSVTLTNHGIETIGSMFHSGRFPAELPEPLKLKKKLLLDDAVFAPMLPSVKTELQSKYWSKPDDQIQGKFDYLWKKGKRGMYISTHESGAVYGDLALELISDRSCSSNVMSDEFIKNHYQ